MPGRRSLALAVSSVLALTAGFLGPAASAGLVLGPLHAAPAQAQIRVDQLGFLPGEAKHARLMTARKIRAERFKVLNGHGDVVLRGHPARQPTGHWNSSYHAVYDLNLTRLSKPGTYHIVATGDVSAQSPTFKIARASQLYGKLLRYGVSFDQVQRDGASVIRGALDRKPAHLHDRHAMVYRWPTFVPGSDEITDHNLHRIGGPVDVSGGWYDAGDYLKFTHSTAYADVILFLSQRMLGKHAPRAVGAEARHGLAWLRKMWDAKTKTLYIQVGVGSGNRDGTFSGDHDHWRLPQADDHLKGHFDRFVSHRPVFEAAAPGSLISPNLAGRVSAAFALAAQVDAASHHARALRELHTAARILAQADTTKPPRPLVTALPHAFYPESTWKDDMELGAAETALAARRLGEPSRSYVHSAADFARGYIRTETGDTLNLYDTSALAHADLAKALAHTKNPGGLAVGRSDLVGDVRRQLLGALHKSQHDPFAAGGTYDNFDVNSHTFALIATAGLYHGLVGPSRFDRFATSQRNWLLGGNPWGVSAMVGIGTTFPLCMQHQIANLKGTIDGSRPVDKGAVVNGPNAASIFSGGLGGFQGGMVHCPPTSGSPYQAFDGRHSRYVDDVRSWQTDEPALDMTGAAIIAAAVQLSTH